MKQKDIKKEKKGTKERIRDVAIDLFSQKGYNAVSIRDIARLVDISESTIYSHYKGKEDIIDTIIDYLLNEFRYQPEEISIESLLDKYDPEIVLNNATKPMLEQLKKPQIRKVLRLMCIELYRNDKFLDFFKNQFMEPSYSLWTQVFQKMIEKEYILKFDANLLAKEFFNYCLFLFFECFLVEYNETSYETLIDNLINKLSIHIKFLFDLIRKRE